MHSKPKPIEQLISVHVIEKEMNNDIVWRWTFPNISDHLRYYLRKHSLLENDENSQSYPKFCYYHYYQWIYVMRNDVNDHHSVMSHIKEFSIIIIGKDFNPEKYETFAKILSRVYRKTANFSKLLNVYLSVAIQGSCNTDENGTFVYQEYDQLKLMSLNSHVKSIIKMFGLDIILIYTALILKKRIAVYHHKLDTLLQFVRSLPAFVWHRQNWDEILYPIVDLTSRDELEELKDLNHYVAGFLESEIEMRPDLYDVFVNLAALEITMAHNAKEHFSMTKTHKDIAVFMTRHADSSASDYDVIKEIMGKTNELIKTLKSMGSDDDGNGQREGSSKISLSIIKTKKLSPALESFLSNLAIAENLV